MLRYLNYFKDFEKLAMAYGVSRKEAEDFERAIGRQMRKKNYAEIQKFIKKENKK